MAFAQTAKAKTILQRLKSQRSPVATLLEQRICLIDRAQILMFKRIKSLPRAELCAHLDALQKSGFKEQVPLRVTLDILERQCDDGLADFFGSNTVPQATLLKMAADHAAKFKFWGDATGEIQLLSVTLLHCIDQAVAAMDIKEKNGQLSKEDAAERNVNAEKAGARP